MIIYLFMIALAMLACATCAGILDLVINYCAACRLRDEYLDRVEKEKEEADGR